MINTGKNVNGGFISFISKLQANNDCQAARQAKADGGRLSKDIRPTAARHAQADVDERRRDADAGQRQRRGQLAVDCLDGVSGGDGGLGNNSLARRSNGRGMLERGAENGVQKREVVIQCPEFLEVDSNT